jgi:hypothetical protein
LHWLAKAIKRLCLCMCTDWEQGAGSIKRRLFRVDSLSFSFLKWMGPGGERWGRNASEVIKRLFYVCGRIGRERAGLEERCVDRELNEGRYSHATSQNKVSGPLWRIFSMWG